MDSTFIIIGVTSFLAATVNGALGYGYSSITVPVALLMVASRILNPALVLIECAVNLYALFLGRRHVRAVWPRVSPVAIGILPGVIVGSMALSKLSPDWAKLITYATLLPLILIQAAGLRFPFRRERLIGVPFGGAVGVLYSLTTISGPPLALYFNNQGLAKDQFKVALALTRSIESLCTLVAYLALGMITYDSVALVPVLAPGVLIGLPLGFALITQVEPETFRRVCMSFDAWLVGFGLSRTVAKLGLLPVPWAYQLLTATIVLDAFLLRTFFRRRQRARADAPPAEPSLTPKSSSPTPP